jgi:hypothetical protein
MVSTFMNHLSEGRVSGFSGETSVVTLHPMKLILTAFIYSRKDLHFISENFFYDSIKY